MNDDQRAAAAERERVEREAAAQRVRDTEAALERQRELEARRSADKLDADRRAEGGDAS